MKILNFICVVFLIVFFATQKTYAGDAAHLDIIGFSDDGAVFAFEEYGISDGAGFPYANRYYIDTSTDKFLNETPIRIRIETDQSDASPARDQARIEGEAATMLTDTVLRANSGYLAAFSPMTEISSDPLYLAFHPRAGTPAIDAPLALYLEEMPFAAGENCFGFYDTEKGFRLKLVNLADNIAEPIVILNDDLTVPSSRACPISYRLAGVVTQYLADSTLILVVLVQYQKLGFEGPDTRWLAITHRIAS